MDQVQWSTPNKNDNKWSQSPVKSPGCYKTPIKSHETRHKQTAYQNSSGGFTVLPNHITPPSGFTKFVARNPFDANLTNRLHLSVISPTVFSKISSPKQDANFVWNVEELALIKPAAIEEFPIQQLHCSDPEVEIKAQAAIDQFFNKNQIIPSPWSNDRKCPLGIQMSTPVRPQDNLNNTRDSYKTKKDGWTQTTLSLPPELPKELEEALKPYFTFTQEQQLVLENDEANLSNNSLRRKLFFNHDEGGEMEGSSEMSFSPERSRSSMILGASSNRSGIDEQGVLKQRNSGDVICNHGTPRANSGKLSPPILSPISNDMSIMSYQSIRSRVSRSVARLDFTTDMSIETSITEEKKYEHRKEFAESVYGSRSTLGTSVIRNELNSSTEDVDSIIGLGRIKRTETVEMLRMGERTPVKCKENTEGESQPAQPHDIVNRLKFAAEWCRIHSNESYAPQNNTFAGISGQQSSLNSAQDTGYQTHSMNNTSTADNVHHATPVIEHIRWEDKILLTDDDLQLSDWKQNMMCMFSSTPSKNKDRDN